jgi:hypothetical protein
LLSGRVTISVGAATANVVVEPVDDRMVEGVETVGITIEPPVCIAVFPAPPDCYQVGANNHARAAIRDNDVAPDNQPPKVVIVRPEDGDIFTAPADVSIYADARDADGRVRTVEFFAGDHSLGVVSNSLGVVALDNSILPVEQIFRLVWQDVPVGVHALTAVATDNEGARSTSEAVRIKVIAENRLPVVTIEATDPFASEGDWILDPVALALGDVSIIGPPILDRPNIGVFAVKRDGGTNAPLTVWYELGGTASNGEDYQKLEGQVTIPTGASRAYILVQPIDDKLVEGTETVVAALIPVDCAIDPRIAPPVLLACYRVGEPDKAVAYIRDNDFENQPPKVEIVAPANGDVFPEAANIEVAAQVRDPDGYVTEVEFFAGDASIGKDSRVYIRPPPPGELHRFSIAWSNVPPGRHLLTAKATDDGGASSRSEPVEIKVVARCPVPVVTLRAIDKVATEQSPLVDSIPDTAAFRVSRTCDTDGELKVRYAIGGTAVNGVDYQKLEGLAVIPAGAESVEILIDPIDDDLAEGTETVELKLMQPDCPANDPAREGCYVVGTPAGDIAFIRDNESLPPNIAIVKPENGARFKAGTGIDILAQAVDPDGWVARVEFFADSRSIGVVEVNFLVPPPPGQLQRFSITWSDAPAGRHVLTAKATDELGVVGESRPVSIEVVDASSPPVVNIFAVDPLAREGVAPPNPAVFRLRRSGETDAPLTVHYAVLGTAENGVDYLTIPTSVTIPAGRRTVRVVITPIDDRVPERIETVVLRLYPAALYNVGRWGRAGALILDNDCPAPDTEQLPDRNFHVRADGKNTGCYRVELSDNLEDWESLEANVVTDDAVHFVDPEAGDIGARYYRVVPVSEVELFEDE